MGLMKKLTSSLVASSLVLGLVGSAFAAPTADATNAAFERLNHYNIAKGKLRTDGTVDPALAETITRAELVTVIVRAFGQDDNAKLLNGAASFNDVATNEWYSGYVALAKKMAESKGITMGYEDGSFKPTKNVSTVEALAFIMKFLGVKPGTGANWAADTLKAAIEAGVVTTADAEVYLDAPDSEASRGLAFALADSIFYSYNKLPGGKSIYTAYVDTQAPVVTLDKVEPTTTAASVKISGKVSGDYIALMIGTEKITPNEDGTFTAEVKLAVGENTINVIGKDLAGNEGVGTTVVTRTAGTAAKIQATLGAAEVVAGGETELTIKVLDANDAEVAVPAADIKVTTTEGLGTYADGKFTAGTKAGTGTITATYGEMTTAVELKIIAGELVKAAAEKTSVAPGTAVKLIGQDTHGNAVDGVTFGEDSADAFIDGDLFTATKAGQYTVKAMKGEIVVEGTVAVFGAVTALKVENAESVVANGKSEVTVTVYAVDEKGNVNLGYEKNISVETVLDAKDGITTLKAKEGKATFTFTASAGLADSEVEITAKSEKLTKVGTIQALAQVATSIKVKAPEFLPTNTVAPKDITVEVLDQEGKPMVDGAWEFDVAITGAASLDDESDLKKDTVNLTANDNTFPIYPTEKLDTGAVTITVSYPDLASGTASVKAVYAQDAKTIRIATGSAETVVDNLTDLATSKKWVEYTVELIDKNGVPTSESKDVKVVFSGLSSSAKKISYFSYLEKAVNTDPREWNAFEALLTDTTPLDTVIPVENGVGKFRVAGIKAGTFSVKVEDAATSAKLATSASSDFTLKAGKAAYAGFSSEILNLLANASTGKLSAQVYDEFGNATKKAGVKLNFEDATDAGDYDGLKINGKAAAAKDVETDADGKATVDIALESYLYASAIKITKGTDTTIDIGFDGLPANSSTGYDTVLVAVVNTIPSKITAEVVSDKNGDLYVPDPNDPAKEILDVKDQTRLATFTAGGDNLFFKFTVRDNHDRPVTNLLQAFPNNTYAVEVSTSNSKVTVPDMAEWEHIGGGVYYVGPFTNITKAENLTFTVSILNLASDLKVEKSVSVKAAKPNGVILAEADSDNKITFKTGKEVTYTIKATDEFWNEVAGGQVTESISVKLETTAGEFRDANGQDIQNAVITKGRNSTTIKFITSDAGAKVTLTPYYDANKNNQLDAGEELKNITIINE